MPYSKTLGLIFVAIPKTGTTSVTSLMRKINTPPQEALQLVKEPITSDFRKRYGFKALKDKHPGRAKHLSAIQIKYVLGEEEFNRCAKFSVVRNPWARMVSRYFFTHKDNEPGEEEKRRRGTTRNFHNLDFDSWLRRAWLLHKVGKREHSQLSKLVDLDGRLLVDHVGRLENVQATLDWIREAVGVGELTMPHVNGTRKGHYAQYYNPDTINMVGEMCRKDIEYFNYRFDE